MTANLLNLPISMPSRHDFTRRSSPRDQGGFVLVAVLLLIALATVLIVTTSSVSQIERKAVANSAKEDQARQNALFALQVALAQLQKEAGPDQRITATADIMSGGGTTVNNPYWTGVWKTGTNGLDRVNVGTPQRQTSLGALTPTATQIANKASWLVSGASDTATVNPLTWSDTSSTLSNSIALATNYGTNTAASYKTVRVPLVQITNSFTIGGTIRTNVGAYAYWVSDEGVKAKVNMTDPTLGVNATADLPRNLLHFLSPQATASHKGSSEFGTTDLRSKTNDVPKITTLQSLANIVGLSGLATNASRIAPDFTAYSYGVLADVRKGGLKKDLTAAFEDTGANSTNNYGKLNPSGTNRVYTAPEDTIGTISTNSYTLPNGRRGLDGLRWMNLYYHYNLYKSVAPTPAASLLGGRAINGTNPVGIGNPAASTRPYTVAPRGVGWSDGSFYINPTNNFSNSICYSTLTPVFLGLRWDVAINSTDVGGGNYQLELRYYPQFIIYNPYSVRINSSANNFRLGRAFSPASSFYLQVGVPGTGLVTNSSSGLVTTNSGTNYYHAALNLGSTLQRMLYNTSFDSTQTLEPGEIRVYGISTNIQASLQETNSTNGAASEFKFTNSPYGLVSSAANSYKYAEYQRIIATNATNSSPLADTYGSIPAISATNIITLRITGRPSFVGTNTNGLFGTNMSSASLNYFSSGNADVSIPTVIMWPTLGGSGGSTLPAISGRTGSGGGRIMSCSAPGVATTGAANPTAIRPDFTNNVATLSPTQVFSFFVRKKGINVTGGANYNNPSIAVPWFSGNSINFNLVYDQYGSRWWDELYVGDLYRWPSYPGAAATQINADTNISGYTTTSWGNASMGATSPDGSRIVLIDVPVQPMVSLGQFMHLQPFYMFSTGDYTALGFGTMFIGGSLPSPEVPLNQTALDFVTPAGVNYCSLIMDHSFLANQALFDSYFFSTVPPSPLPATVPATVYPTTWTAFNTANPGTAATLSDPSKPLLNSRMKPYFRGGTNPPVMADLRDMDKAAANLVLDGPFNINSTSVAAWKAFLSSTSGNDINIWNASSRSDATISASTLANPFVRFAAANSTNTPNNIWSGIRALSDIEVNDLATRIVAEVKTRGPFLSMADFLNRRLAPDATTSTDLYRAGTLQAAIDKTSLNDSAKSAGVNINVPSALGITGSSTTNFFIPPILANMRDASSSSGAVWKTTIGAPGYFMQQDLVQALSPAMTARSDTFVIRAYGEVRNPRTGVVESRAYAEAVVQRTPEFVDQSDSALTAAATGLGNATAITNLTSSVNINFGRRFKVVSFRWLNSNEI